MVGIDTVQQLNMQVHPRAVRHGVKEFSDQLSIKTSHLGRRKNTVKVKVRPSAEIHYSAGMNLHIKLLDGINTHHMIEAMFKAFAKALDQVSPSLSAKASISL